MQFQYVETRHTVIADIAARALHVLVAARAESLVAGTRKYDDSYVLTLAADAECVKHLHIGLGAERIVHFGTVDGDFGYAVHLFEEDVFVFLYCFPVEHGLDLILSAWP